MAALERLSVRLRRSSLSVKLAALGAAVTAAVVVVTFWGLGLETRRNTERVFTSQLERNQRTLHQLQDRSMLAMLATARLISRAPTFQYSLKTFQLEANRGAPPSAAYVREIQDQLGQLAFDVNADLLVATDDSGRVVATGGPRGPAVPRGTRLGALHAMQRALDPNVPADSGGLAVLRIASGYLQVAVYPLVQDGFTIGALVMGEPLDSAVARARAASDADVLLTAGQTAVAFSDSTLAQPAIVARLEARAGQARASTIRLGGEDFVAMALSLGETQGREPVRLWMLQPLTRRVAALVDPLRRDFIIYGAFAVIIAALGAALVARTVLGPFTRFVQYMRSGAAAEQRQGRFEAENEAAEVRTLNASFNQLMDSLMDKRRAIEERTAELTAANVVLTDEISERTRVEAALQESEAQLRQSQKLEAIGTLAGGIAHDFNNLITVISGYTQLALMRAEKHSPAADDLRQVIDASDRAANLTHQLLAFSRKQVLQPTVLDLGEVVNGISPMLRRIIGEHIQLDIEGGASLPRVRADRGQIEQVLLNLAVNARDAMAAGGTLTIATRTVGPARDDAQTEHANGSAVSLIVRDTGMGMTAEVKERIFEPFFTTKEVGKGTGLGLSMVYGIVNQSGGRIAVDSAVGRGTTFTIILPAADTTAGADIVVEESDELPNGTETILIVEDADDVRILARRTLEERGYTVRVARNAAEALEISAAGNIEVLLTDIVMPQMSGPELVAEYLATRPTPVVIYMSGYADDALSRYEIDATSVFLRKPFTPQMLARTVRRALDARHAAPRQTTGATHAAD
jgi:signal transduction histidine kinase/ActR/RegA family two-component response regulator